MKKLTILFPQILFYLILIIRLRQIATNLISRLNKFSIQIPVMVISISDSSATALLAIENNASGVMTKNCSREITLEAILPF